MYNPMLSDTIDSSLEARALEEVGIEGFSHLASYFKEFSQVLSGHYQKVLVGIKPTNIKTAVPSSLERTLQKVPYSATSPIRVHHPSGLNEFMMPFVVFLDTTLTKMMDLDTRLYHPLTQYMTELLTQPGSEDKFWISKELVIHDTDAIVKELNAFYNPKVRNRHDTLDAPFSELYRNNMDFIEVGEVITKMAATFNDIDFSRIRERERLLAERVKQYSDAVEKGDVAPIKNKTTLKKIVDTVNAIARETELFALLYYTFMTTQTAYRDSVEVMTKALK